MIHHLPHHDRNERRTGVDAAAMSTPERSVGVVPAGHCDDSLCVVKR